MQNLLKVLIADDEPNIREGIRYSIDWESFALDVVTEAEDGEEALELALKHDIDILLLDLNMPIMNGLTVVKHIREKLPKCRVVIISGYDEFSYAQEALRLNVDDYLLKPVNPENLKNVVQKVSRELLTQSQETTFLKIASNYITQNKSVIQEQFCRDWIEGKLPEDKIKEQLRFLELPKETPKLLVVIRSQEFQVNQPLVEEKDKESYISAVKKIILDVLNGSQFVIFCEHSGLLFILLWENVEEESFAKIEKSIHEFLNVAATLYAEEITGSINELNSVFINCKNKVSEESQITPLVRRAKNYIQEHYTDQELTLESLANSLKVSPVYLSRTIKQELGTPFVTYITKLRIKKAIRLLNSTNLKVNEIAEQVGYESQHYFSTAFKKAVGVSPNQYRKGITN